MSIRILCKQPGFRRAGVVHLADTTWPADFFSAEQLAQILAEPKLVVTVAEDAVDALLAEAGRLSIEAMASLRRDLAGGEGLLEAQPAADAEGHQAEPEPGADDSSSDAGAPVSGSSEVISLPEEVTSLAEPTLETGEASDADPAKASEAAPPKKSRKG